MGLDSEVYWRMSPQESFRWLNAKRPRVQIGGMDEDTLNRLSSDIYNDTEGKYI